MNMNRNTVTDLTQPQFSELYPFTVYYPGINRIFQLFHVDHVLLSTVGCILDGYGAKINKRSLTFNLSLLCHWLLGQEQPFVNSRRGCSKSKETVISVLQNMKYSYFRKRRCWVEDFLNRIVNDQILKLFLLCSY